MFLKHFPLPALIIKTVAHSLRQITSISEFLSAMQNNVWRVEIFEFPSLVSSNVEIYETLAFFFGGGLLTQSCSTPVTPWTIACQVPLSMQFSRQEYWSGFPFPPPRDLPHSGIELISPVSPTLQADSFPLSHHGSPFQSYVTNSINAIITL